VEKAKWFESMFERTYDYLANPELWINLATRLVLIILIVIVTKIVAVIAQAAVNKIFVRRENGKLQFEQRRLDTLRVLTSNATRYLIYFLAMLLILDQLGLDLGPVLVSAGVLGLAVGFGAQSLVKDVISGFFIIFEDQFAVGDYVTVNTYTGTVQEIGLRTTKIKSWTGEVHIITNGSIQEVTNFSLQNSVAVVDVSVTYEENIDEVQKVLADVLKKAAEENENIVQEPQILGVQDLGPSNVVIRITAECKPTTQYAVARMIRAMVKTEFIARGIKIPYPKVTYVASEKEKM
jgi:small conductance mechanosensitive channel